VIGLFLFSIQSSSSTEFRVASSLCLYLYRAFYLLASPSLKFLLAFSSFRSIPKNLLKHPIQQNTQHMQPQASNPLTIGTPIIMATPMPTKWYHLHGFYFFIFCLVNFSEKNFYISSSMTFLTSVASVPFYLLEPFLPFWVLAIGFLAAFLHSMEVSMRITHRMNTIRIKCFSFIDLFY